MWMLNVVWSFMLVIFMISGMMLMPICVIFPTCHYVILFQSLHYWELAMYMYEMLSTLNFIFVMTIWDDIFVFLSSSHFCVVSLSTFALRIFCFLYVNVECSLIIHFGDCHPLGYDIVRTFIIFQHLKLLYFSKVYTIGNLEMYMFGILSTFLCFCLYLINNSMKRV